MIDILAISGSLRAGSTNSALLAALARNAPENCRVTVHDGLGRLPIFNPDEEGERAAPEVRRLIEAVARADGVVISCPEYAHGVPGGLKNALDWLVSGEAAVAKPAMLVHASHRSLFARATLAEILRTMSFALYEGAELEIALLGKHPDTVDAELAQPVNVASMRETLSAFAAFIGGR